jgi:hypothetical protein
MRLFRMIAIGLALPAAALAAPAGASELTPAPLDVRVPRVDIEAPTDPEAAQAALMQLAERRAALEAEWAQRRVDCHDRFLVNPCLAALRQEQHATLRQLDAVEIAARQALRDDAAYQRNLREAQRLEREQATLAAELERREANRRRWEARQQAAREDAAQRERDDAAQRDAAQRARDDAARSGAAAASPQPPERPRPARATPSSERNDPLPVPGPVSPRLPPS